MSQPPRLLDQVRQIIRLKHLSEVLCLLLAAQQPESQRKRAILVSVKGVGEVAAALCLAELPDLEPPH